LQIWELHYIFFLPVWMKILFFWVCTHGSPKSTSNLTIEAAKHESNQGSRCRYRYRFRCRYRYRTGDKNSEADTNTNSAGRENAERKKERTRMKWVINAACVLPGNCVLARVLTAIHPAPGHADWRWHMRVAVSVFESVSVSTSAYRSSRRGSPGQVLESIRQGCVQFTWQGIEV